jgi:hypothetical protein
MARIYVARIDDGSSRGEAQLAGEKGTYSRLHKCRLGRGQVDSRVDATGRWVECDVEQRLMHHHEPKPGWNWTRPAETSGHLPANSSRQMVVLAHAAANRLPVKVACRVKHPVARALQQARSGGAR